MRVIIQRVTFGRVKVDNELIGSIDKGYVLLVGITHSDNKELVDKVAKKIVSLRINDDENGKLNLSLNDINGKILSISQFTLYADCKKGRRPGFDKAAKPEFAAEMYEYFNEVLRNEGVEVETGKFQAEMQVELNNSGPITIIIDTDDWN